MCNACGFYCCAWDGFDKCGCDHCPNPDCHDDACISCGEEWCDGDCDDMDYDDLGDERDEMMFDCGVEGCLMPGEHLRSECHTAADLDAMYDEHEQSG